MFSHLHPGSSVAIGEPSSTGGIHTLNFLQYFSQRRHACADLRRTASGLSVTELTEPEVWITGSLKMRRLHVGTARRKSAKSSNRRSDEAPVYPGRCAAWLARIGLCWAPELSASRPISDRGAAGLREGARFVGRLIRPTRSEPHQRARNCSISFAMRLAEIGSGVFSSWAN